MNLNLPLDYESTPEFWQLCDNLRAEAEKRKAESGKAENLSQRAIDMSATFLWMRLWVSLGYLAKSTNKPGRLRGDGLRRLTASLEPVFAENVVKPLLTGGGTPLLLASGGGHPEEWDCPLFAKLNAHTAGDYKPGHVVGNIRSRISAARKAIAQEADAQAMLLPPEVFKFRDGTDMHAATVQRSVVLIMTLDRCLKSPPRTKHSYTPGLMADAGEVVRRDLGEEMTQFFYWIAENGAHPLIPKTTEEILANFERIFAISKA